MTRTPRYTNHPDLKMPAGFPVDGFTSALGYTARPDDILISTYPKCGTTWMQHIVWLLFHEGEPLPGEMTMTAAIPHLEEVGAEFVDGLTAPRVIKTHLPFDLCPSHPEHKVIYVTRNPFDCAVSFFHHTRGFVKLYDFAEGTFDEYFECFVRGEVDFGDYFDNVSSWLVHVDKANFLLLTYEQMKADPLGAVTAVGQFLGGAAEAAVNDQAVLDKVLSHSSFASMAKEQQRWSSQRPDGMPAFVRKGEVGDWINHFSPAQLRRLLERLDAAKAAARMQTLWPEIISAARAAAG